MLHSRQTCFLGDSRQAEISAAGSPASAGNTQICISLGITSELCEVEKENNTQRLPLPAWAESSSSPKQCHNTGAPAAFSYRQGT